MPVSYFFDDMPPEVAGERPGRPADMTEVLGAAYEADKGDLDGQVVAAHSAKAFSCRVPLKKAIGRAPPDVHTFMAQWQSDPARIY